MKRTTTLLFLSAWSAVAATEYLEPTVVRIEQVLPIDFCNTLINLGEEAGFNIREESIDEDEQKEAETNKTKRFIPSQTIDVYEFDEDEDVADVGNKEIWGALQPYIPKIKQIVKDNRNKEGFAKYYPDDPDREPHLDWIFFRKYSPEDERNSLKHHHDTNMNTVNIELSNDYEGGGLFYIKPLASTREIDKKYEDMNYEWVDTIKRENTTEISFPELHAGDAIFYNYTVEHGVAPVESGKRYSMAFFFDMDNPEVEDDLDSNDSSDDNDSGDTEDEDEFAFDVKLKNELPDQEVDVVLVLKMTNEEIWKKVFDDVKVNETTIYNAYEGDSLKILKAGTDDVITELDIKREQSLYTISLNDSAHTEL